jgi:hypothetical protein
MPTSASGALLDVAGLVHDQHRARLARLAQVLHGIAAQVIAQPAGIYQRPTAGAAASPGDPALPRARRSSSSSPSAALPAALAGTPGHAAWARPGRIWPDREHQLVEAALPPVQVYAGPSGHRTIVMSLHKPR